MAFISKEDVGSTIRILVAADCHLGYMEKDEIRCQDSFETFNEIFLIAKQMKVDFVLLGGNLFHENKPSPSTLVKTIDILRQHCIGDNPVQFHVISDQTVNFANTSDHVNPGDIHSSVDLPVFSIHGSNDGPAGVDNFSAVDILSACNLLNYFGKIDLGVFCGWQLTLRPILIRKGSTSIALYGLGNFRDEQLNSLFQTQHGVQWIRPKSEETCPVSNWFNILVLHQKRAKANITEGINEGSLPQFLDFIVWGHEHECLLFEPQEVQFPEMSYLVTPGSSVTRCLIDPQIISKVGFQVAQPGSSVATSLDEGDSKPKHVLLLEIKGKQCFQTPIPLNSVRPFEYAEVVLKDTFDINPNDQNSIFDHLDKVVKNLIEKNYQNAMFQMVNNIPLIPQKMENKLPLVRVKVDCSGFTTIDPQRFEQNYVGKVANPHNIFRYSQVSRKDHGEDAVAAQELGYYDKFFKEISFLGQGAYGAVFKCRHLIDNKMYAVKKIGFEEIHSATAMHEVIVHSKMDHPNVVRYINSWIEEGCDVPMLQDEFDSGNNTESYDTHTLYIQMELCDGSIYDIIENCNESKVLRENLTNYKTMCQIYQGLEHIHSNGYIHGDVTPKNILYDKEGVIKISDFGKAKVYKGEPLHVSEDDLGAELYQSPERSFDLKSIQLGTLTVNELPGRFLVSDPLNRPTASEAVHIFETIIANEEAEQDEVYANEDDGVAVDEEEQAIDEGEQVVADEEEHVAVDEG